jgi:hypothetical protein
VEWHLSDPITLTPETHLVFNEFDEKGLLLGLPRLSEERNASYKDRLLDVFVHRPSSSAPGLLSAITRGLGLSFFDFVTVAQATDINGVPLYPRSSIQFNGNLCQIYSDTDPANLTLELEIDRLDPLYRWDEALLAAINSTTSMVAGSSLYSTPQKAMEIFNQSSCHYAEPYSIAFGANKISLKHRNILPSTIVVNSNNLRKRVYTEGDMKVAGDYYINEVSGTLSCIEVPANFSTIYYAYVDSVFTCKASPVIINNLQQEPFYSSLFITEEDELGKHHTVLSARGIETITELYTVAPVYWGP